MPAPQICLCVFMPCLPYDAERIFLKIFHGNAGQIRHRHPARELQADARLTNAELAQRVGLSAAPCWRRVRALEEGGFIKGYRAEIDRHKIGLGVLAFVRLDADRNTGNLTRRWKRPSARSPKWWPATTSAAPAPSSCRWWPRPGQLFAVCARGAAEPAQRERHAHQLLAGRGQGQRRVAPRQLMLDIT
jgi:hypothetical protein